MTLWIFFNSIYIIYSDFRRIICLGMNWTGKFTGPTKIFNNTSTLLDYGRYNITSNVITKSQPWWNKMRSCQESTMKHFTMPLCQNMATMPAACTGTQLIHSAFASRFLPGFYRRTFLRSRLPMQDAVLVTSTSIFKNSITFQNHISDLRSWCPW